jgi:hypothetical protein
MHSYVYSETLGDGDGERERDIIVDFQNGDGNDK